MQPEQPQSTQSYQSPVQDSPKKSKKKVLLAVLVLLAFVAVAAGAWWYGDSQATKKADAEVADLQSQIDDLKKAQKDASESKDNQTSAQNDSSTKYLVIKEWGVKLPLSTSIYDSFYAIDAQNISAYLATPKLAALDNACDPRKNTSGGEGALVRARPTDVVFDEPVQQRFPNGKTINGYYYYFSGPQATCYKGQQTAPASVAAFSEAAKGIEAAN